MEVPPYIVSELAVRRIAEISGLIERYAIRLEQADGLRLRRANRIRTIHSSLAIEGNGLTEGQVADVLDGRVVVAPERDLREVRNALRTYDLYPSLDPFCEQDLLRAHATMMDGLVEQPGRYRRGGVGVYSERGVEHVAPPAGLVPTLMAQLFGWLRASEAHLLVRSCVFHYEFEFIHPFMDGNGRMGRLWQSLLLGRLHPLFQYLPVENLVYANQEAYYQAIAASTAAGQSGPFIDFMLGEILHTLREHQGEAIYTDGGQANVGINHGRETLLLDCLRRDNSLSAKALAEQMGLSARQVERLLMGLRERGILRRVGARKNGHWEIVE